MNLAKYKSENFIDFHKANPLSQTNPQCVSVMINAWNFQHERTLSAGISK